MLTVFSEQERLHAPALQVDTWLNLTNPNQPITFIGKVTLLDFWDYSCINCLNTLPYIKRWYEQYQAYGLQVIGLHAPEFSFAKDANTIQQAIHQLNIQYPVGLDNQFKTWQAYTNRGWPTQYVIDSNGYLKSCNRGEGNAYALENNLRQELAIINEAVLSLPFVTTPDDDTVPASCKRLTPELYLGKARGRFGNITDDKQVSQSLNTSFQKQQKADTIYLNGPWQWEREYLESKSENTISSLKLTCQTGHLLSVIESPQPTRIHYRIDQSITGWLQVHQANCYSLAKFETIAEHHLELWCETPGVKFYTLLFQP